MAINKNFVIKNGLEVATDLIVTGADNTAVGIGSTIPKRRLDVLGDVAATGGDFTGIITSQSGILVGSGSTILKVQSDGNIGIGQTIPDYRLDIQGVGAGLTAVQVVGDLRVVGTLNADNLGFGVTSNAEFGNLNITGIATINNANVTGIITAPTDGIYTRFGVTNSGSSYYVFSGSVGIGFTVDTLIPTLYLWRGVKYRFEVNAGGHPFWIKTDPVTGTGSSYNAGVTNNGVQIGNIDWEVPQNAPATLYYICQNHSAMQGTIYILDETGAGGASRIGIQTNGSYVGQATVFNYVGTDNEIILNGEVADVRIDGLGPESGISSISITSQNLNITGVSSFIGTSNFSGDMRLSDNDTLFIGDGEDLQISHTPETSTIREIGSGNLEIHSDNLVIRASTASESYIVANYNSGVELYYDSNKKFETLSVGATAFGDMFASRFIGDGSGITGISTSFISAVGVTSGGLSIGSGTTLNFVGAGVTILDRGNGVIDVSAGGGGGAAGAGYAFFISKNG